MFLSVIDPPPSADPLRLAQGRTSQPGVSHLNAALRHLQGHDEFWAFLRLLCGCSNECNGSSASFVERNVNYFQQSSYVANERLAELTFPLITLA